MMDWRSGSEPRSLSADAEGAVYAEYTILLALVTLLGVGAIAALGPSLVLTFRFAALVVALPVP